MLQICDMARSDYPGAMTPSPSIRPVPNQPREDRSNRTFRETDEVWDKVKEIAKERGETITDVIHRALERYIRTYGHD